MMQATEMRWSCADGFELPVSVFAAALKDPRGTSFQDWGRLDLHTVLEQAFVRFPGLPVFLAGHSAGAQVVGLTPHAERLAGLVFIAGPRPHVSQDRGAGWC